MTDKINRRYEVTITVSADSYEDLCKAVSDAQFEIETRKGNERHVGSHLNAGPAWSWHVAVEYDHDMTPDKYFAALQTKHAKETP